MKSIETKWVALRQGGAIVVDGYLLKIFLDGREVLTVTEAEAGALCNSISHSLDAPLSFR